MTQKDLLLKDLCCRLPYKFTVHRYSDNVDISIDDINEFAHFLEYSEGEDFKPYLRPMSSMTEEEVKEFAALESIDILGGDTKITCVELSIDAIDWLNKHHFDYRGLIGIGLALEAPEDMYNTKTE